MKKLNKKGFTLAELLIVVAIIAVLVAVSIPVFTAQLEKSREETDVANLRSAYAIASTDALSGSYKYQVAETGHAVDDAKGEYTRVGSTGVYYAKYNIKKGALEKDCTDANCKGKGTSAQGGCEPMTDGPLFYTEKTEANKNCLYVVIYEVNNAAGGVPDRIYAGFAASTAPTFNGSSDFVAPTT